MITKIKNGHKYQLSMDSDSLTFSGGISINFALPLPSYNGVELRRIYQKINATSLYYEDINGNESVFSYPFTITFFVLSHSNFSEDLIDQYITELYCDALLFAPNVTHTPYNIVYGDDTTIEFTANEGYILPSTISVTNATYTWNGDTGILTIQPSNNTISHINITIMPVQLFTITATTPNSFLNNPQQYVEPNDSYTTKIVFQAGYIITAVSVTMGGVEQSGVYNPATQTITIPIVTGDVVIDVTTAEDESTLSLILYKNSSEPNRVDKTNYLELIDSITGTFKTITDILNPVIDIEYSQFPNFNYVYIGALKRYYFVTSISSVSKNIWRISMAVDVLMTYAVIIKQQNGFIERNQFIFNKDTIDDEIKYDYPKKIEHNVVTDDLNLFDGSGDVYDYDGNPIGYESNFGCVMVVVRS